LRSTELAPGEVKPVRLLGRDLVVYRGQNGRAVALDAYCPHMGAHLAEGRVEGNDLRCFFHDWKFDCSGACVEVPRMDKPPRAAVQPWPTAERYGMIWVWTGAEATGDLPYVPELKDVDCDARLGNRFIKNCHPNVVLINAIDENHFNSVHNLPVDLLMETVAVNQNVQTFSNTTKVPSSNLFTRTIGRFYAGPLTYSMCYHFGSSGTVTVGPDLMHFHIMFALRMIEGGKTEGQTILITKRRPGALGQAFNRVALAATKVVGDYFAKGDTQVFQTMKFDFKTPTKADHAIVDFVQHVDKQRALTWGSWAPVAHDERVRLGVVNA
jgi:phenylpropionate dioxygenase-like ring-hydroxylating dioxygenase large terminal subunit